MKILAIDTATESCSVALNLAGTITEQYAYMPQQHAQQILTIIESHLTNSGLTLSDIDVFAFGRGPGSFTGVRIGSSVIQGIATACDKPVAPVSDLQALAQLAYRQNGQTQVLAAIDARMGEIYWGGFAYDPDSGLMVETHPSQVSEPEAVNSVADQSWFGIGSGWDSYHSRLIQSLEEKQVDYSPEQFPHAYDIAMIAAVMARTEQLVSAELAIPLYLRDKVAKRKQES